MKRVLVATVLVALIVGSDAWADGWVGFGGNAAKGKKVGPPPGFVNTPASDAPLPDDQAGDDWEDAVITPRSLLEAGPPGPQGPPGPAGPQGPKGDSADLCANLPGVQTSAGWKRWPQRFWTFKPRLERRVLALNRKWQIVCVTLSWVKKHGWRGRR